MTLLAIRQFSGLILYFTRLQESMLADVHILGISLVYRFHAIGRLVIISQMMVPDEL